MDNDLVIIGAGGFGRETAALVEAINAASSTWRLRGFLDDDSSLHGTSIMGYPVLGSPSWMAGKAYLHFVIAIGASSTRRQIAHRVRDLAGQPAALIHPRVDVHHTIDVGAGSIICAGCSLTVDIQISTHAILNLHCTVGHDTQIRDFATLHPGVHLSGNTTIGSEAELGTGAVVLPGQTIGERTTVGAGAVVTQSLPPHCTAVGVPARPAAE